MVIRIPPPDNPFEKKSILSRRKAEVSSRVMEKLVKDLHSQNAYILRDVEIPKEELKEVAQAIIAGSTTNICWPPLQEMLKRHNVGYDQALGVLRRVMNEVNQYYFDQDNDFFNRAYRNKADFQSKEWDWSFTQYARLYALTFFQIQLWEQEREGLQANVSWKYAPFEFSMNLDGGKTDGRTLTVGGLHDKSMPYVYIGLTHALPNLRKDLRVLPFPKEQRETLRRTMQAIMQKKRYGMTYAYTVLNKPLEDPLAVFNGLVIYFVRLPQAFREHAICRILVGKDTDLLTEEGELQDLFTDYDTSNGKKEIQVNSSVLDLVLLDSGQLQSTVADAQHVLSSYLGDLFVPFTEEILKQYAKLSLKEEREYTQIFSAEPGKTQRNKNFVEGGNSVEKAMLNLPRSSRAQGWLTADQKEQRTVAESQPIVDGVKRDIPHHPRLLPMGFRPTAQARQLAKDAHPPLKLYVELLDIKTSKPLYMSIDDFEIWLKEWKMTAQDVEREQGYLLRYETFVDDHVRTMRGHGSKRFKPE